ncbi:hypothetical protein [Campylobacter helveticus]|uniref:hypothetical protein n=1 Tax=Campylobacter helveticus TaxID=28898 RepID=UPI0022EAA373|nr:hypothetical protein [Campylobacter helveticus]
MKIVAHITLATTLSFALFGCGESGTRANLVDKFSDDFETFKKEALECDKVVFMPIKRSLQRYPFHKELVQSYIDELKELDKQAKTQGISNSLKDKADSIYEKMEKYKFSEDEERKYDNTCAKLGGKLYKNLSNQQEYDIYKERLNPESTTTFYIGSKEYQKLEKELKARNKAE